MRHETSQQAYIPEKKRCRKECEKKERKRRKEEKKEKREYNCKVDPVENVVCSQSKKPVTYLEHLQFIEDFVYDEHNTFACIG